MTFTKTKATTQPYIAYLSYLRICATFAIILLHTCSAMSNFPARYHLTDAQFAFYALVKQFQVWAVPCFFMLTGAVLLGTGKEITLGKTAKFVRRLMLALFLFGVPFSMLELIFEAKTITLAMLPQAFWLVLSGQGWAHLWYLYTCIGLYLIAPILSVLLRNLSKQTFLYLLALLYTFHFVLPALAGQLSHSIGFSIPLAGEALFYLLLGAFLQQNKVPHFLQLAARVLIALFFGGVLVAYGMQWEMTAYFSGNANPLLALVAAAIFLQYQTAVPGAALCPWVRKIDRLCFTVYLIHPVFINLFYKACGVTPASFGWWGVAVLPFFVGFALLSFVSAWVLSKVPYLNRYVL